MREVAAHQQPEVLSDSFSEHGGTSTLWLVKQSKILESALTFRETCDSHLSVINVLSRIDDVEKETAFHVAFPPQAAVLA